MTTDVEWWANPTHYRKAHAVRNGRPVCHRATVHRDAYMVGEDDDIRRCTWCEMALARTPAPPTQTTAKPLTAPLSAALGALYDVDGERLLALALDDLDRHADTLRKATDREQ